MWTRICNLQMECNILPMCSRITALNIHVVGKALSQLRDAPFTNRVKIELCRNPNFPISNTWIAGTGRAARKCILCRELLSRKPKNLNELYRSRAPWEDFLATFNYMELPNSKANCTEQQLKGTAEEAMRKVYTEGCKSTSWTVQWRTAFPQLEREFILLTSQDLGDCQTPVRLSKPNS